MQLRATTEKTSKKSSYPEEELEIDGFLPMRKPGTIAWMSSSPRATPTPANIWRSLYSSIWAQERSPASPQQRTMNSLTRDQPRRRRRLIRCGTGRCATLAMPMSAGKLSVDADIRTATRDALAGQKQGPLKLCYVARLCALLVQRFCLCPSLSIACNMNNG